MVARKSPGSRARLAFTRAQVLWVIGLAFMIPGFVLIFIGAGRRGGGEPADATMFVVGLSLFVPGAVLGWFGSQPADD